MSDEQNGPRQQNQVFQPQSQPGQQNQQVQLPTNMAGLPTTSEGPAEYRAVDDLGFDIPVDTVPLPSRGLCYHDGSSLHGRNTIDIRAMTAREEDILTSKALLKNGTVITQLLRSCIVDKRINPVDMLSGDRTALLVALRITGYGQDYKVETECPECGHKQIVEFDLQELPMKFLEQNPDLPGQNVFSVKLPVSKKTIRYRFLTGLDEEQIQQEQQIKRKKLKTQLDNMVTSRLLRQIIAVDNRDDKGFINKFIQNMPARDSRFLRKHIADNEPGMEMVGNMVCSDCGEASEVEVQIGPSFFWPDD